MKLLFDERNYRGGDTVLALGMFDGVHLAHHRLLETARDIARREGMTSAVLTFRQHPLSVLAPNASPKMLTTPREKTLLIGKLGLDVLVLRNFDLPFAHLSAEAFVAHIAATLRPKHVVVGYNYSFGEGGKGTPQQLAVLGERHGFVTHCVEAVHQDGQPVSSSRVREAVARGDMPTTQRLLGRPYALGGTVVHGKKIGRTLGFPTANLRIPAGKLLPPFGVYAARVSIGSEEYEAVLNIGAHPTLPGGAPTIEAFLINASLDLYHRHMRVQLLRFLRPEEKFDTLDALKEQIARDVQKAKSSFLTGEG